MPSHSHANTRSPQTLSPQNLTLLHRKPLSPFVPSAIAAGLKDALRATISKVHHRNNYDFDDSWFGEGVLFVSLIYGLINFRGCAITNGDGKQPHVETNSSARDKEHTKLLFDNPRFEPIFHNSLKIK
ncbi:hypothetical protein ACSQ67_025580 [Phaseolus vulgaris]